LYSKDANGNPIVNDLDLSKITASVDGAPESPTSIVAGYPVALNFNLTRAGPRLTYVYYDGVQVANPLTVMVVAGESCAAIHVDMLSGPAINSDSGRAGPASALTSIASGPGLASLKEGENTFTIVPKDRFGNALQYSVEGSNLVFVVSITPVPACYKADNLIQQYTSDGTWQVSYTVEGGCGGELEQAQVSVLLDGSEILVEDSQGTTTVGPTTVYNMQLYTDESLSNAAKIALIILGALGLATAIVFHAMIHHWRETNVIKFSQRRFVHVIMAGAMLSFGDVIVRGLDASDTSCM
jgi:hypothetical protein